MMLGVRMLTRVRFSSSRGLRRSGPYRQYCVREGYEGIASRLVKARAKGWSCRWQITQGSPLLRLPNLSPCTASRPAARRRRRKCDRRRRRRDCPTSVHRHILSVDLVTPEMQEQVVYKCLLVPVHHRQPHGSTNR
jgi:hypothetical protein